jgi:hypothetical protein
LHMFEEHPSLAQDKISSSKSVIISETAATVRSYPSDVETSSALTQGPENTCSEDGSLPRKRAKSLKTGARSGHHACEFCKERKTKCDGHIPCQQCQELPDQSYAKNCPKLPPQGRRKNRKLGTACDQCKKSKRRCEGAPPRCNTCDKNEKTCTWGGPVEVPVRDSLVDSTAQNTLTSENEDSDDDFAGIGRELIQWATNEVPGSGLSGSQESSLISGIRKQKPRTKVVRRCPPCQRGHLVCDDGMPCNPCVARGLPEYCSGDKELPELKRGRPSRACDRCRLKSPCDGRRPCHRCQAAGAECTWTAADSTRTKEEDDAPFAERD